MNKSALKDSIWSLHWSDELSVGIPELDMEHQHLLELIDNLNESIVGKMDLIEIHKRMHLLIDFKMQHLIHEEEILRKSESPSVAHLAHEHEEIVSLIENSKRELKEDSPMFKSIGCCLKIKKVLIEHMISECTALRGFCKLSTT